MDILISNLLSEPIFDFRKWSNWKYANTSIWVFSVRPLPEVENWFRKQIWNESVHIFILIFFGAFGSEFKKSKNGFPIVFSKCDFAGGGGLNLWRKKFLKKPNTPKYSQVLWYRGRNLIPSPPYYPPPSPDLKTLRIWKIQSVILLST